MSECEAPPGSPCRTRGGKTATKYHTARFLLVPTPREELEVPVPVPDDRGLGRPWKPSPATPAAAATKPIRFGYARCSTADQELRSRLGALARADCKRIFSPEDQPPRKESAGAEEGTQARVRP
ncbi:zinc finger domain-containing protein [Streptomyces sporangiiformans]|uniref:zinc finger domain-containing protein n=1 Tax=Streptomyces sporangiiformans TaxID=2315329 RepID=UPI003B8A80C2